MSIKQEKTKNKNEIKITFTVEASKFDDAIMDVFKKSAKYFNIPGFRKGKAPFHIVERYYGDNIFYEDAFNELVPKVYDEEIKANKIEAVSRPHIDVVQMEKGKDLIFTAIVNTKPEVELGKYKGVEIKKVEYKVTDKDVDDEINHMAEHNSRKVTVEDRPVQDKDMVNIDFEGTVDGVPFEGGKAEKYDLTIGSHSFIEGFEDQIIGMKIGEEKDINVTFPKEYFEKNLAGKPAVFHVKLNSISVKELPKLDTETENAAIDAVIKDTKIDIPEGMIELEIDQMEDNIDQRLQYQGLSLNQYLKMMGKTENDMRKEYREDAIKNIQTRLVLEQIVADEKIKEDEKYIKDELEKMAKQYGKKVEELEKNEDIKDYLSKASKNEQAVKLLVDNAKFTK